MYNGPINPQALMASFQSFMGNCNTPNGPLGGMAPDQWVQQQLNSGKMSQQDFNRLRDLTNQYAPMFGIQPK